MNGDQLKDTKVDIGGQKIILDWKDVKIAAPENLQETIGIQKDLKQEARRQKEIRVDTTSSVS